MFQGVSLHEAPLPTEASIAEDLMAALDESSRRNVASVIAELDEPSRRAASEAIETFDAAGADVESLVAALKGKTHDVPLSEESESALRRLFQLARKC